MANHELKSLELLQEVDDLEEQLRRAYDRGAGSGTVADLHQRINRSLKKADIHATHALRQAIEDVVMTAAVPV